MSGGDRQYIYIMWKSFVATLSGLIVVTTGHAMLKAWMRQAHHKNEVENVEKNRRLNFFRLWLYGQRQQDKQRPGVGALIYLDEAFQEMPRHLQVKLVSDLICYELRHHNIVDDITLKHM